MSKKGKEAILLPEVVQVEFKDKEFSVKGPRGILSRHVTDGIDISIDNRTMKVIQNSTLRTSSAMHGLERSLMNNMIIGVSEGFAKTLQMVGTGYRVTHEGSYLDFKLMKSHPVKFQIPEGIEIKVEGTTVMHVSGNDKRIVGQTAADISRLREKDPYKGKGIHIKGEFIRRKAGKSKKK
ncbi:MAG: 50S ribosomal protein L6 [Chlamydiia bacterium]|nr:50S ribosomal protein L6 [Chlamydiia bacterium]